jgi:hypothetical protein
MATLLNLTIEPRLRSCVRLSEIRNFLNRVTEPQ